LILIGCQRIVVTIHFKSPLVVFAHPQIVALEGIGTLTSLLECPRLIDKESLPLVGKIKELSVERVYALPSKGLAMLSLSTFLL